MRPIDADELKQTIDKLDVECPEYVVSIKEIYKLRDKLQKLSDDNWGSYERSGCSDRYLLGKTHAYSVVVNMIDYLLEDNLGGKNNA